MGIVFNTEFNNKLNCRGDGKLYLLYEAASVFPDAVESKVNGLLRAEHCGQFRNIDRSGVHALASIQIESFIPCVDGVIVRGVLSGTDCLEGDRIVAFNEEACVIGESL